MGPQKINWGILCILCGLVITNFCVAFPFMHKINNYVKCEFLTNQTYLEGEKVTRTCRLDKSVSPAAPYTLTDLQVIFPPSNVSKVFSKDGLTLNLTFSFKHDRNTDYQYLTYKWPDDSYGVGGASFRVVAKPLRIDNMSCEIQNWENMTCKWSPSLKAQDDYAHNTKVTNRLELYILEKGSSNESIDVSKDCNANKTECRWKVNEVLQDGTSVAVGDRVGVKVIVAYTYDSHLFPSKTWIFNTSSIVRVNKLQNFTSVQPDRDLSVSWSHPSPGHCIQCNIYAVCLHETKFIRTETKEDRVKASFKSLIPNTDYNVSASCRACTSDLWSDVTTHAQYIRPQVPEHHPLVRPDAFEVKNCRSSHCSIILYWQPLLPYEENGKHFMYEVKSSQGHQFNTTRFSTQLLVDSEKAFEVQVFALNSLGKAHGPPTMVQLHPKDSGKVEFTVEGVNSSVVYVEVEEGVKNFTVFWCPMRITPEPGYPGQCKDYIRWTSSTGHSNNLTLTLPPDYGYTYKDFLFAVASESSKSITWSQCSYDLREGPTSPEVHLSPVQESESLHLVWKPILCISQPSAFSDSYVLSYCPVETCPDPATPVSNISCTEPPLSITLPGKETNHFLRKLPAGISHMAWLTSVARNGEESIASAPVCHTVLAHWLTAGVVSGFVIGSLFLLFMLIAGAYFMTIRCRKAKAWLKGSGMNINVPEKEKFPSQKTLTSEHQRSTRGINNSLSSFDSGMGTISQSDYHHVFSMPMMRGFSSESEADEVFENASEHYPVPGSKHFPHTFGMLPPLREGKPLKQMGKNKNNARSNSSKGSGYNSSLGSYVLQPGVPDSVKSTPSIASAYVITGDANYSDAPLNTSNSNNNDHSTSLEDVRCNASYKSLQMDNMNYVSTDDLNANPMSITKDMLCAADQDYVRKNDAVNAPNIPSNLHHSDSSLCDDMPFSAITLNPQQTCAHFVSHPGTNSYSPNSMGMTKMCASDDYLQRDQRPDQRREGVILSLGVTDTNDYVVRDIPINTSDKKSPVVNGQQDLNTYIAVSNPDASTSTVSMPKYPSAKDVPQAVQVTSEDSPGYIKLPTSNTIDSSVLKSLQTVPIPLSDNQSYVTMPSASTSNPVAPVESNVSNISSTISPSISTPHSPPNVPSPSAMPFVNSHSSPISSSHPIVRCTPEISSNGYVAGPTQLPVINPSPVGLSYPIASPMSSNGYVAIPTSSSSSTAPTPTFSSGFIPPPTSQTSSYEPPSTSDNIAVTTSPSSGYIPTPSPPSSYIADLTSSSGYVATPVSNCDATTSPSSGYIPIPSTPSGYVPTPSDDVVIPPSLSSHVGTPMSSSSGYVPFPTCSSSGYVLSSNVATPSTGDDANVSSVSSECVADSSSPSNGYVVSPPTSPSGCVAPPSSNDSVATASAVPSHGYVAVPPTVPAHLCDGTPNSNGCVATPSVTSDGYVAIPPPDCQVPTSSSDAIPLPTSCGYVAPPVTPLTSNGYVAVPPGLGDHIAEPRVSSSSSATEPPASSNGYVTVPQVSSVDVVSGYVTDVALPALTDDCAATKPAPTSGYIAAPPVSSIYVTAAPQSLSHGYVASPNSSRDVMVPPVPNGYVTTPLASSVDEIAASVSSSNGYIALPSTSHGDKTAMPPSHGYIDVPPTSSNCHVAVPTTTSNGVAMPPTSSNGYVGAPLVTSNGHVAAPPTSANYVAIPPTPKDYVGAPPVTSNGYVTVPSNTSDALNAKAATPSLNGYVVAPPHGVTVSPPSGYVATSSLSSNGYALAPPAESFGTVGGPISSSSVSPSGVLDYVAVPLVPPDGVTTPPASLGGYVAAPQSTNTVAGPTLTSNGYVTLPSPLDSASPGGCVEPTKVGASRSDFPTTSSGHVTTANSSYVTSPLPSDGYVTVPPPNGASQTPPGGYAACPPNPPGVVIGKYSTEVPPKGYIAFPPSGPTISDDALSLPSSGSGYVTNASLIKPSFVLAI